VAAYPRRGPIDLIPARRRGAGADRHRGPARGLPAVPGPGPRQGCAPSPRPSPGGPAPRTS
jgi:hypothetical protein